MTTAIELPKEILEKAVTLRNAVRTIFIELFLFRKPVTVPEIASIVKHNRAYVNMRLNQLEDMGYVRHTKKGKTKFYEVTR